MKGKYLNKFLLINLILVLYACGGKTDSEISEEMDSATDNIVSENLPLDNNNNDEDPPLDNDSNNINENDPPLNNIISDANEDAPIDSIANDTNTDEDSTLDNNDNDVITQNRAPIALTDNISIDEDTSANNLDVLSNDVDADGDNLDIIDNALHRPFAVNGSVTVNANKTLNYVPSENWNGSDIITYMITDNNGGIAIGKVAILVNPINDIPTTEEDEITVTENLSINNVDVLSNDTDIDGDSLIVIATGNNAPTALNGVVTVNSNSSINYTPNKNFSGTDTIVYTTSDGNGGISVGTVNIVVTALERQSIKVSWGIPNLRADGSELQLSEIFGYNIRYRLIADTDYSIIPILDPTATNIEIEDLVSGRYEVSIQTIDTQGIKSAYTSPVLINL